MGRLATQVLNDIFDALGWSQITSVETNQSPYTRKGLRALNRVLRTLASIDDWFFLRKEGEILTTAPYITGAVLVTNGSTTVTGTPDADSVSPAWTASMVGRAFQVDGDTYVYRIEAVTSPISLTLHRAYLGTTVSDPTSPASYTIAQDTYDLPPDFDRPIGGWYNFFSTSQDELKAVSPNEFLSRRASRGSGIELNDPAVFTAWGTDEQNEHRVILFDPWPNSASVMVFQYQRYHPEIEKDSDRVLFPLRFDPLIIEGALYLLRRDIEDAANADVTLMDFLREKNDSLAKKEPGESEQKRISPSGLRARYERYKWKKGSARIDYGSYFDRADFYDL